MVNVLAHGLTSLAVQGTAAYLLGWPALSPTTFLAALVGIIPDVTGEAEDGAYLHAPKGLAFLAATATWMVALSSALGLIPRGTLPPLLLALAVGLGLHPVLDLITRRFQPDRRWRLDLVANGLSLGVLLVLIVLSPR